jgi:hypothetical protein
MVRLDVGLYGVGFFTPIILAAMAFTGNGIFLSNDIVSTEGTAVLDVFLVIGFVLDILLIDRWGRIRLQVLGFAGITIGLLLLAAAGLLSKDSTGHIILVFGGFAIFNLLV